MLLLVGKVFESFVSRRVRCSGDKYLLTTRLVFFFSGRRSVNDRFQKVPAGRVHFAESHQQRRSDRIGFQGIKHVLRVYTHR